MPYSALRQGRVSLGGQIYLITTVTARRTPVFADLRPGRIVVRALKSQETAARARTLAFVVMPDHLHWLLQLAKGQDLSMVVKTVKASSALEINRLLWCSGAVWQPSFHDHAVRREEDLRNVARYVVCNPIRAGLVRNLSEYSLWDTRWLSEFGDLSG